MHAFLVVSITHRGKYTVAGVNTREMADAMFRRLASDPTIFDVQVFTP
jgi:hypothetical protein